MKRIVLPLALACAGVSVSSCTWLGYGRGPAVGWVAHPYVVWYDGYYGSFYDGYWGLDGIFYYRLDSRDREYRRGAPEYFHRDRPPSRPGFKRYEGIPRNPPKNSKMPNYPR